MTAPQASPMDAPPAAAPRVALLAGLNWKGVAILLAVCLVNALRRNIINLVPGIDPVVWLAHLWLGFVTGCLVGSIVTLAVVATVNRMPWRGRPRYVAVLGAAAVSSAIGVALLVGVETGWTYSIEYEPGRFMGVSGIMLASWSRYLLYACLFAVVYLYLRDKRDGEAELRRLDTERAAFEQRTTEARLQRLQAQIEPHFLFNTLAHVRRLYQTDPSGGRAMLDSLLRYLAEALPQMREPRSNVAREAALAEAYLRIQQVRMGGRLRYRIETDPGVEAARLPPMMLLTLVENAVKHGISPLPEGGTIELRATRVHGQLAVDVRDTGAGLTGTSGTGTGIANIQARLSVLFGTTARLTLGGNRPRGVVAALRVPFEIDEPQRAVA